MEIARKNVGLSAAFKNLWKYFTLFEKILFMLIIAVSVGIAILEKDTGVIVFVCLVSGVICEILVTKQNRVNFYFSLTNDLAEGLVALGIFGGEKLFMTAGMNFLFWMPNDTISIFRWRKHKKEKRPIEAKVRNLKWWHFAILFSVLLIIAYPVSLLLSLIGQDEMLGYVDSLSGLLEISSGVLILLRFREYAFVWSINTIIDTILWFLAGHPILALMNLSYLVIAIYGYVNWTKAINEDNTKQAQKIKVETKGV